MLNRYKTQGNESDKDSSIYGCHIQKARINQTLLLVQQVIFLIDIWFVSNDFLHSSFEG